MSAQRETPWLVNIPAESDDNNALTMLRHSKICGIYLLKNHAVAKTELHSPCMVFFKTQQVFYPRLAFVANKFWVLQLKQHVPEILRK